MRVCVRAHAHCTCAGNAQPMLKTYGPPRTDAVPVGVDYVSTEPQQLLTAYYPGTAGILDLETGKTVLSFDCSDDGACVVA